MSSFGPENDMTITDPVCGMRLNLDKAVAHEEHEGWAYFFCSRACHELFLAAPGRYASRHTRGLSVKPEDDPWLD